MGCVNSITISSKAVVDSYRPAVSRIYLKGLKMNRKTFEALWDLQQSIDRLSSLVAKLWVENEHRCPLCKKALNDIEDINFMEAVGMCISCDHILPDGWSTSEDTNV